MWKTIARLVRGGQTAERAIIEIQKAYGFNTSVTRIIGVMICDKDMYPGGIQPNIFQSLFFVFHFNADYS